MDDKPMCRHWSSSLASIALGYSLSFLLFRAEFAQSLSLLGLELGAWILVMYLEFGRARATKKSNGHGFGIPRQPIYLLAQIEEYGRQNPHNPYIEVMLQ